MRAGTFRGGPDSRYRLVGGAVHGLRGRYPFAERPEGYSVSSPVPGPPLVSADAAARALQELFLANADRGDHAANDELVAELLRRIRALRATHEGRC